jgi:signal peptidase I
VRRVPGDNHKNGIVYIDGKEITTTEELNLSFSYSVVLDGKTPIDFEYLLKMDLLNWL